MAKRTALPVGTAVRQGWADVGPRATDAYIEFFTATIVNRNTRVAPNQTSLGNAYDGAYDLAMTDEYEEVLAGGNMTAVVRVGDTVRRGAGPWTATIHAFMRHLRASGVLGSPDSLLAALRRIFPARQARS